MLPVDPPGHSTPSGQWINPEGSLYQPRHGDDEQAHDYECDERNGCGDPPRQTFDVPVQRVECLLGEY